MYGPLGHMNDEYYSSQWRIEGLKLKQHCRRHICMPPIIDVILAVTYFSDGYYAYGTATAALAFVPTVAVQVRLL